jgi:hypothetical protein
VKDCFCCLKTHVLGRDDGKEIICDISSSHNSVAEDSVLQGCDAVTLSHPISTFTLLQKLSLPAINP